nr:immunoglobulin heavy chain junction region [Mus musculus]
CTRRKGPYWYFDVW